MSDPTAVQRFLDTWAPHCGAPRSVFEGHFRVMLKAVLEAQRERGATIVENAEAQACGCDECKYAQGHAPVYDLDMIAEDVRRGDA